MPDFSIPLSGLTADNTALATISNNLSNLNTTGYKDTTVNFQDMFYNLLGSNGSGDQLQVGSGTSVASTSTNFTSGTTSPTGVNTDVAITGNGFFVVQNGSNTLYTRSGAFTQDTAGNLITADGYNVMGYSATNGVINTNAGLQPIQIPGGMINPPQATTTVSFPANLSADAVASGLSESTTMSVTDSKGVAHTLTVDYTRLAPGAGWSYTVSIPSADVTNGSSTVVATGGPLAVDANGNLTSSTAIPLTLSNLADGGTGSGSLNPVSTLNAAIDAGATYNTSVTVYDSLGTSHVVSLAFTRTSTGWDYNATLPSGDITGGAGTSTSIQRGSLTFNSDGNLTSTSPIAFSVSGLTDGASTMAFNWDLADSSKNGLITQVSGNSTTGNLTQDGYAAGTLSTFNIGADGTITGVFSNGTKVLGQVALANFGNLQGLSKEGDSNYGATISSGSAAIGTAGSGSLGTLTGGSLELSNVDMSTEFSNLIIAERGFQANAKSVTTFDQIAQDTINLIR